jgi:hypothetical protein
MNAETKTLWTAVITGVIVMLAFAVIFVNLFSFVPFIGPFVGGLVAGLMIRRGTLEGGRAGLYSGVAGAFIVSLDYLLGTGFLTGATIPVVYATVGVFVIMAIIYFAFLAFIGGAIGGLVRK